MEKILGGGVLLEFAICQIILLSFILNSDQIFLLNLTHICNKLICVEKVIKYAVGQKHDNYGTRVDFSSYL